MMQQTLWTAAASLLGILAVIGLGARLYKGGFLRRIQNPNGRTLVLLETVALDPRRRLHLVQCKDRRVILLTGGSQDVVVGWMPET